MTFEELKAAVLALPEDERKQITFAIEDSLHWFVCVNISAEDLLTQLADNDWEHYPQAENLGVTLEDCREAASQVARGDWSDSNSFAEGEAIDLAIEIAKARKAKAA